MQSLVLPSLQLASLQQIEAMFVVCISIQVNRFHFKYAPLSCHVVCDNCEKPGTTFHQITSQYKAALCG